MCAALTTSPSRADDYIRQLAEAGITPEVNSLEAYDEVRGRTFPMCQIKWKQPSVVTEATVPDAKYSVIDEQASLPSSLFGWAHYVWGVGHIALDALGIQNKLRSGESFLPEVGEIFWVVNPPGTGIMSTEEAAAAAEVASWPCQKWQRIA